MATKIQTNSIQVTLDLLQNVADECALDGHRVAFTHQIFQNIAEPIPYLRSVTGDIEIYTNLEAALLHVRWVYPYCKAFLDSSKASYSLSDPDCFKKAAKKAGDVRKLHEWISSWLN